jgi:hypothetical protein
LLALRSPTTRVGYDYWKEKRGTRLMPSRSDIDPAEIAKILPHVFLLDVKRDPIDFRYRLIGAKMDEYMLGRYTGMWMSQIPHQAPPSQIHANCRKAVTDRVPFLANTPYVGKNKEFLTTEDLIMPLADDGERADMLFVVIGFV